MRGVSNYLWQNTNIVWWYRSKLSGILVIHRSLAVHCGCFAWDCVVDESHNVVHDHCDWIPTQQAHQAAGSPLTVHHSIREGHIFIAF